MEYELEEHSAYVSIITHRLKLYNIETSAGSTLDLEALSELNVLSRTLPQNSAGFMGGLGLWRGKRRQEGALLQMFSSGTATF